MDTTIELLKQAEARIREMRSDYELALLKMKEVVALLDKHIGNDVPKGPDLSLLSDREKEVFNLLGQNMEAKAISKALGIAPKTVRKHRDNIRAKLNISTFYELNALAQQIKRNLESS